MSAGASVPRRGPRGDDDLDYFHEIRGGTVIHGDIGAISHPFDLLEHEAEELKREIDDAIARRRPAGFTARWDEPTDLRRVA